jgi:hypothetical protein
LFHRLDCAEWRRTDAACVFAKPADSACFIQLCHSIDLHLLVTRDCVCQELFLGQLAAPDNHEDLFHGFEESGVIPTLLYAPIVADLCPSNGSVVKSSGNDDSLAVICYSVLAG